MESHLGNGLGGVLVVVLMRLAPLAGGLIEMNSLRWVIVFLQRDDFLGL